MNRNLNDQPSQVQRARQHRSDRPLRHIVDRLQKALCEPARLDIVQSLQAGELSVAEIASIIDRTPSATSQHLRVLRDAGLVEGLRHGMNIRYRLRSTAEGQRLRDLLKLLEQGAA
jgi:DNA-binding transcriptional ArsR family regulator